MHTHTLRAVAMVSAAMITAVGAVATFAGISSAATQRSAPRSSSGRGVLTARRQLQPYLAVGHSIGVLPPLPKLHGKPVVDFLYQANIPNSAEHATAIEQAASHAGLRIRLVNGGDTPSGWSRAWQTIVANKPAGAIYDALPYSLSGKYIKELTAKKIPVVGLADADLPSSRLTFTVLNGPYFSLQGKLLADWVISNSGGKANILYMQDKTFAFEAPENAALMSTFKNECPGCKVTPISTPVASIGPTDTGAVASYLQSHPTMNYLVVELSSIMLGLPQALNTAGVAGKVKIIGYSPTTIEDQYLKQGELTAEVMEATYATGWYAVDAMTRMLAGETPPAVDGNPPMSVVLTSKEVTWNPQNDWPYIPGWQSQFVKAWKK